MRKTKIDLTPKPYRLLKTDIAAKLSPRSEGGGLWSKEAVALTKIEEVLSAYDDEPFPTKALRGAVVGRFSNNPPFLCAVLKDLGLIAPAPDKAHPHVRAGDWEAFRRELLALSGEKVMYPPPATPADVLTIVVPGSIVAAKPGTARPEKAKRKKSGPPIVMSDAAANVDEDEATERADDPA